MAGKGADVEIFDYRCPEVESSHDPARSVERSGLYRGLKNLPVKLRKHAVFDQFRADRLWLSSPVGPEEVHRAGQDYAILVAGSDQVWSPRFSGRDETYLLGFVEGERRYSYAASIGENELDAADRQRLCRALGEFACVSVRERQTARLLEEMGVPSRVDVDPTLLMGKAFWEGVAQAPGRDGYILVYTIQPPCRLLDYARALAERTGREVVYLNNERRGNRDFRHARYSTPEEFLGWFRDADYVLTNSFHGTAFSVVFSKRFKVEVETMGRRNARAEALLEQCELTDATLGASPRDWEFAYDWDCAKEKLEDATRDSQAYLASIVDAARSQRGASAFAERRPRPDERWE